MAAKLKITLVRSTISAPGKLKKVVAGLGLRRISQTVVRPNDDSIRGMVKKVPHLVEVSEVDE